MRGKRDIRRGKSYGGSANRFGDLTIREANVKRVLSRFDVESGSDGISLTQ
jgi:hypothetical protein